MNGVQSFILYLLTIAMNLEVMVTDFDLLMFKFCIDFFLDHHIIQTVCCLVFVRSRYNKHSNHFVGLIVLHV